MTTLQGIMGNENMEAHPWISQVQPYHTSVLPAEEISKNKSGVASMA
jgi:hypothetical protein